MGLEAFLPEIDKKNFHIDPKRDYLRKKLGITREGQLFLKRVWNGSYSAEMSHNGKFLAIVVLCNIFLKKSQ